MFPGMGGMNPAQMKKMMQQLGIKTEELKASRVIFETDEGNFEIENPQITKMTIQGTDTFQLIGELKESKSSSVTTKPKFSEDDIKMVSDQAGVSKEKAKQALEETDGDIAEAILMFKK